MLSVHRANIMTKIQVLLLTSTVNTSNPDPYKAQKKQDDDIEIDHCLVKSEESLKKSFVYHSEALQIYNCGL